jgi:hypothetical protein
MVDSNNTSQSDSEERLSVSVADVAGAGIDTNGALVINAGSVTGDRALDVTGDLTETNDDVVSVNANVGGSAHVIDLAGGGDDRVNFEGGNADSDITADLDQGAASNFDVTTNGNTVAHDIDNVEILDISDMTYDTSDIAGVDNTDETIFGGVGDDTIEAGAGADTLDGGAGDDTFVYEGDGSDGEDTINNFVVGDDAIEFNNSAVVDNAAADLDVAGFALLAGGAATVNDGLVVIDNNDGTNTSAASLDVADVEAYLGDVDGAGAGASIDADDADDHFYIAVSDGNDTALFEYTGSADTANTAIEDDELDLIVTLNGIGDAGTLSAANFDGFA